MSWHCKALLPKLQRELTAPPECEHKAPVVERRSKHGAHLLDHDASFPHCIDASETGDNVIPHSEDELELVMGGFFEREGMAPGDVGGGGEWEWQLKLFSPFCPNP